MDVAGVSELRAEFAAALPNIQGAVRFGDGACRLQLDIPESDLHESLKLALMYGKVLRVVIVTEDGE